MDDLDCKDAGKQKDIGPVKEIKIHPSEQMREENSMFIMLSPQGTEKRERSTLVDKLINRSPLIPKWKRGITDNDHEPADQKRVHSAD